MRACLCALLLLACDGEPAVDAGTDAGVIPHAAPIVRYDDPSDLFAAPWPDERLREEDGTYSVAAFPNPRNIELVDAVIAMIDRADGAKVSSTIYFPLTGPIDTESLPNLEESLEDDASVFLIDVETGERAPIVVAFSAEPQGPFAPPNLLAVLPMQGRPLRPNTRYAAVVTTRVLAADGTPIDIATATASILDGEQPVGLSDGAFAAHTDAHDRMRGHGIDDGLIAATAVFDTWDPRAELQALRDQVVTSVPSPDAPFTSVETFDEFCVYTTTIEMPSFQAGTPPFTTEGGAWARDGSAFVEQRRERANVYVTVPRRAMPDDGFPTAVFVRTGGGGDRPLIDRGHHSTKHGEPDAPGSGPAMHWARAGWAGVQIDGPLGGLRNTDDPPWDEQFMIFNITNVNALKDNIRQSALELALFAHVLPEITIDASGCDGLTTTAGDSTVRLDTTNLTIMGHSMGATIAPIAAAVEPMYRAMILSGAGGSWIENVIYKERPVAVRPNVELLLRYGSRHVLTEHDPALAIFQWAVETSDTMVYAPGLVDDTDDPRHVLMFQGILDTYIPPPIANALSLAFALDLAGPALDETLTDRPELARLTPLLPIANREAIDLPAMGNREVTAVVVQHLEDGIEDGHEVVFQAPEPQLQYRCFLETLAEGVPRVVASDATSCD
jgi:pimeloyl-ACP methyl ester carboxylesterase